MCVSVCVCVFTYQLMPARNSWFLSGRVAVLHCEQVEGSSYLSCVIWFVSGSRLFYHWRDG